MLLHEHEFNVHSFILLDSYAWTSLLNTKGISNVGNMAGGEVDHLDRLNLSRSLSFLSVATKA